VGLPGSRGPADASHPRRRQKIGASPSMYRSQHCPRGRRATQTSLARRRSETLSVGRPSTTQASASRMTSSRSGELSPYCGTRTVLGAAERGDGARGGTAGGGAGDGVAAAGLPVKEAEADAGAVAAAAAAAPGATGGGGSGATIWAGVGATTDMFCVMTAWITPSLRGAGRLKNPIRSSTILPARDGPRAVPL